MKATSTAESLAVITVLILTSIAPTVIAAPDAPGSDVNSLLAKVRQATVKYHDAATAEADGYVSTVECVEVPVLGGMGIHYVNFALASDLSVNELTPEILLYIPEGGGFKLVGVEYFMVALVVTPGGPAPWFAPDPPPDPWLFPAPPTLFGMSMDGPMPPHGPGQPWHYDFHAYIWQANPDGIFEEWNPTVSCGG